MPEIIRNFLHHLVDVRGLIEWGGVAMVCMIVFAETGLFVGFFLPGDSLLVTAGVFAAAGQLKLSWLLGLVTLCAIAGDQLGYLIGYKAGKALYERPDSRFFKRKYLLRAHDFYEKQHHYPGPLRSHRSHVLPASRWRRKNELPALSRLRHLRRVPLGLEHGAARAHPGPNYPQHRQKNSLRHRGGNRSVADSRGDFGLARALRREIRTGFASAARREGLIVFLCSRRLNIFL